MNANKEIKYIRQSVPIGFGISIQKQMQKDLMNRYGCSTLKACKYVKGDEISSFFLLVCITHKFLSLRIWSILLGCIHHHQTKSPTKTTQLTSLVSRCLLTSTFMRQNYFIWSVAKRFLHIKHHIKIAFKINKTSELCGWFSYCSKCIFSCYPATDTLRWCFNFVFDTLWPFHFLFACDNQCFNVFRNSLANKCHFGIYTHLLLVYGIL